MISPTRYAVVVIASLALGACANEGGPKETAGTLIGAGLGGLAGSQIGSGKGQLAAVGAGVLLGGLLGREVGKSLDKADRLYAQRTTEETLEKAPTGQTSQWVNPDTGHSGTVTPLRTFTNAEGQPCREYETSITVEGRTETGIGTACRQPDGTWRLVN